jgi:hypothetical protein
MGFLILYRVFMSNRTVFGTTKTFNVDATLVSAVEDVTDDDTDEWGTLVEKRKFALHVAPDANSTANIKYAGGSLEE